MSVSKNVHNQIIGYAKEKRVTPSHENVGAMDDYRDHCNQFKGFVDAVRHFGFITDDEARLYKEQSFDKIKLL